MSTNFEDLIMRNTRANQPAAGVPGRLYYVTDEGVTERDTGAAWESFGADGGAGSDTSALHDNTSGEIAAVTEKTTPVGNDLLIIEDSEASNAKKRLKVSNLPTGTDSAAVHDNVAGEIHAVTEKTTPVDADVILIEDSEDSYSKKRVQVANLPSGTGGGGATLDEAAYASTPTAVEGDAWFVTDAGLLARRGASAYVFYGPLHKLTLPPASGGWTALNLSTYASGSWTRGVLDFQIEQQGDNLRGYHRALPSPVKVVMACALMFRSAGYTQLGLFIRDSATGKCKSFFFKAGNSAPMQFTTWNSASGFGAESSSPNFGQVSLGSLLWVKYEEDSTNRIISLSANGAVWTTALTEDKTTFLTADQIGIGGYCADGGASVLQHLTLYSWAEG